MIELSANTPFQTVGGPIAVQVKPDGDSCNMELSVDGVTYTTWNDPLTGTVVIKDIPTSLWLRFTKDVLIVN